MPRSVRLLCTAAALFQCIFQLMAGSPKIIKIAVHLDGSITADGRAVTVEALVPILRDLAKDKGEVLYYREAAQAEPHPNALRVIGLVTDYSLPISLSTKPDYSDVIDDKGRSSPRH